MEHMFVDEQFVEHNDCVFPTRGHADGFGAVEHREHRLIQVWLVIVLLVVYHKRKYYDIFLSLLVFY